MLLATNSQEKAAADKSKKKESNRNMTGTDRGKTIGTPNQRPEIFGVQFDDVSLEDAAARAGALLGSDSYHYCVGTNANLLRIARRDAGYRRIINAADLSLADGSGVICAAHILKKNLTRRVPCIDLLEALLPKLNGSRVYILGGKPGTAELAAKELQARYPHLTVCGAHHGYFSDPEKMAQEIAKASPDLLIVCLGSPRQEKWMSRYGRLTGAKLALGCGGWIDIAAGKLKRAPESWQKRNLEWAWRFLQEPWRFGRVCCSLLLPALAVLEAIRQVSGSNRPGGKNV